MSHMAENPQTDQSKVFMGALLVWAAVIIYASSNSIVSALAEIGWQNKIAGRNAISFCNLLFLGSVISLVPMTCMFRKELTHDKIRALRRKDWTILTISAGLSSALTPYLFFVALDATTVTNVVLMGRIEPPLFLIASAILLKEKLDLWALAGGLIALCGAVVIFMLNTATEGFVLGKGEIATIGATLSFIASTMITRVGLQGIPLGIFSIYRSVLGTIIFYFLGLYLYGPNHFQDLLEPIVLKWVWVYAVIVVLCGQLAWNLGMKHARSGDVSLATSFSPIVALVIAMIVLGEDPGPGLIPGGLIILSAIGIGQYGRLRAKTLAQRAEAERNKRQMDKSMEAEGRLNFKGA